MSDKNLQQTYVPGNQTVTHDYIPGGAAVFAHNWQGTGDNFVVQMSNLPNVPAPSDFNSVRDKITAGVAGEYSIASSEAVRQVGNGGILSERYSVGDVTFNIGGTLTVDAKGGWSFDGTIAASPDLANYNASSHREEFAEQLTTAARNTLNAKPAVAALIAAYNVGAWFAGAPRASYLAKNFDIVFTGSYRVSQKGALNDLPGKGQVSSREQCFARGTPVAVPGGVKNIEDITPGDLVSSFDEHSQFWTDPVVRLFRGVTREWLVLSCGITVTPGHLFLNEFGEFERIDALIERGGMIVFENGSPQKVSAQTIRYSKATCHLYEEAEDVVVAATGTLTAQPQSIAGWRTYNMEVMNRHTYIAGGVRVHNDSLQDYLNLSVMMRNDAYTAVAIDDMVDHFGWGAVGSASWSSEPFAQPGFENHVNAMVEAHREALAIGDFKTANGILEGFQSLADGIRSAQQENAKALADNLNSAARPQLDREGWGIAKGGSLVGGAIRAMGGVVVSGSGTASGPGSGYSGNTPDINGAPEHDDPNDGDGVPGTAPTSGGENMSAGNRPNEDSDKDKEHAEPVTYTTGPATITRYPDGTVYSEVNSGKKRSFATVRDKDVLTLGEANVLSDGRVEEKTSNALIGGGMQETNTIYSPDGEMLSQTIMARKILRLKFEAHDDGTKTLDEYSKSGLLEHQIFVERNGSGWFWEINLKPKAGEFRTKKTFFNKKGVSTYALLTHKNGLLEIESYQKNYKLSPKIEWLTLGGEAKNGTGNALANILKGNEQENVLSGLEGNDTINGGRGSDKLYGGEGDDTLDGDSGGDLLFGEAGQDVLYGSGGDDTLYGGDGNDHLDGGEWDDTLSGDEGNDTLLGGAGYDTLRGGAGADLLVGDGHGDLLEGGDGNDTLRGGADVDDLYGGRGDDLLEGGEGRDFLYGEAGNDTVYGEAGSDELHGGDGNDTLHGGAGADLLVGGAGDDRLEGGADGDLLFGSEGDDLLLGQDGDDTIEGGVGADNLLGGQGNDRLRGDGGDDVVDGGEGADYIDGGYGDDNLSGGAGSDALIGGSGDDTLNGGAGNDALNGDDGNDVLNGDDGDDILKGGAGSDNLAGGTGHDSLYGGAEADSLSGADGDDMLHGDGGNDTLDGGEGRDSLWGGAGNDSLDGGVGDDVLTGDAGDDTLRGGLGGDMLSGGAGNDYLDGEGGRDQIFGGDGNDIMIGGPDVDYIDGGAGEDTIVLSGNRDDYFIRFNQALGRFSIVDERAGSPDGTDLADIEIFAFAGGIVIRKVDLDFVINTEAQLTEEVIDADGSKTKLGWQAWSVDPTQMETFIERRTATDMLVSRTAFLPDGTRTVEVWAATPGEWTSYKQFFDANAELMRQVYTNTDGTERIVRFDPEVYDVEEWTTLETLRVNVGGVFEDRWQLETKDEEFSPVLKYVEREWDPSGATTFDWIEREYEVYTKGNPNFWLIEETHYDNGSRIYKGQDFTADNWNWRVVRAYEWEAFTEHWDALDRKTWESYKYRTHVDPRNVNVLASNLTVETAFDVTGAANWSQIASYKDFSNALFYRETTYDTHPAYSRTIEEWQWTQGEWSDRVTDWDILDSHRELHQEDVWRGGDGGIERKIIRQWDYTAQIAWKLLVSQQRLFAGILLTDKEMTLFDNDTYAVASLDPIDENATWDKYVVTYTSAVSTLVMKEEYFYDTGRYQSWEKDRFSQFTWDERLTKRVTSDAEDYYEKTTYDSGKIVVHEWERPGQPEPWLERIETKDDGVQTSRLEIITSKTDKTVELWDKPDNASWDYEKLTYDGTTVVYHKVALDNGRYTINEKDVNKKNWSTIETLGRKYSGVEKDYFIQTFFDSGLATETRQYIDAGKARDWAEVLLGFNGKILIAAWTNFDNGLGEEFIPQEIIDHPFGWDGPTSASLSGGNSSRVLGLTMKELMAFDLDGDGGIHIELELPLARAMLDSRLAAEGTLIL